MKKKIARFGEKYLARVKSEQVCSINIYYVWIAFKSGHLFCVKDLNLEM